MVDGNENYNSEVLRTNVVSNVRFSLRINKFINTNIKPEINTFRYVGLVGDAFKLEL